MRKYAIAGVAALVATGIVLGCGSFGSTDNPAADSTPAPPEDAAVNAVPPVMGEPLVGVFVSSSKGNDQTAQGTAAAPWKTLAAAMQDAKTKSVRVLVCAEEYPEAVTLIDGVSMYGSYDCSASKWKPVATRATVHSPTSPALLAKSIALDTRIDGFEFYSPDFGGNDPTEAAASSVGIEIHDALKLVIANALVHAGSGGPGKDGTEGTTNVETSAHAYGVDAVASGGSSVCPFGGSCLHVANAPWLTQTAAGGTSACSMGASGGAGGTGGAGQMWTPADPCDPAIAPNDAHGKPLTATLATAAGSIDYCTDFNSGVVKVGFGVGAAGAAGADGPDGKNGLWSLTSVGFVAGSGTPGSNGVAGQGGGGGGGTITQTVNGCVLACPAAGYSPYDWSSRGAGGGAGGCAGFAGTAGFGGGASIGALVDTSTMTFSNVTIASSGGGRGGRGTLGSSGLAGGNGGAAAGQGGRGGIGGVGGFGGLSGNGAPGPSIALAYSGTRPLTPDGTVLQPGAGGPTVNALTKTANQGTKSLPAISGESLAERVF